MAKSAQEYVRPQAQVRYEEQARQASGAPNVAAAGAMYPLYGLGQVDPASTVVWYRQPVFVLPAGVAIGFGLGWLWFNMMPKWTGRVKAATKALKGEE